MFHEKIRLRKECIISRNKIENKKDKSKEIISKLILEEDFKKAKIIAIYKSIKSEVDTTELIKYSINMGKLVVLPKVEENELKFYKINSINEKLLKSNFGIDEPLGEKENFADEKSIELVIVPGICFDIEKNRLGFGKGYYDRFLTKGKFKTIAICFEEQILPQIPITENDVKMDKIITDKRIIS